MAAGTMTELTDLAGGIDTTDALEMAEAYQKVFIVNGENLVVADFINTKIATTNVGSNPPDFGTILTGGTSGAEMIVDYVTALSSACTIYGYRTTTATFSTETVTGTDDDGNAISFATSGAEDAPPHGYTWTAFGGSTDFGALPDKVYLICLFNGRIVLSGNTYSPHQWYMSRQGNPWDWAYIANDAQSPVAGGDDDPGEIGDIIRALIPFDTDRLIIGCANSIMQMRGDPMSGGVLGTLDSNVGVFGSRSWCFDGDGNLYFWGTGGIYKCTKSGGVLNRPELLTAVTLPNIIEDEGADPSTHRITMGYDRRRLGIIISVTLLSSGSNSCYWFDLRTNGLFPESYPAACGAYSIYNYAANDPDYSGLLIGCGDGYIRTHVDTATNDDTGATNTAISSYCALPIKNLGQEEDLEGKLVSLTITTAGGASSGAFTDTDGLSYELHAADDAETCLEDIIDGATARESGTVTGTGRKNRIRKRVRARALGIKLYNSTASQTWAVDEILGEVKKAGKL